MQPETTVPISPILPTPPTPPQNRKSFLGL